MWCAWAKYTTHTHTLRTLCRSASQRPSTTDFLDFLFGVDHFVLESFSTDRRTEERQKQDRTDTGNKRHVRQDMRDTTGRRPETTGGGNSNGSRATPTPTRQPRHLQTMPKPRQRSNNPTSTSRAHPLARPNPEHDHARSLPRTEHERVVTQGKHRGRYTQRPEATCLCGCLSAGINILYVSV